MKSVQVEHLVKTYGPLRALNDVSVTIQQGELFFLLGPSGCGKTTLLRSIAGFVIPDSGTIHIGEVNATRLKPRQRQTAMVFQSYALWPHMTVFDNVAFGLKLQKLDKQELRRRTEEALALVRMDTQAGKKPNQLSGGQQQRVALARALVVRPSCLLLDEPLSNLDAKLREEMRNEIRRLCKQNGLTGVYVTHDQKEALAVADRIAVMNQGQIVQVGDPSELYRRPCNRFVADFLGQANLLRGTIRGRENGTFQVECPLGLLAVDAQHQAVHEVGQAVALVIRPEAISPRPFSSGGEPSIQARVAEAVFLGELVQQQIVTNNGQHELMTLGLCGDFVGRESGDHAWWIDPQQVALIPDEQ